MRRVLLTLIAIFAVAVLPGCATSNRLASNEGPFTWGFGEQPLRVLLGVEYTDNVYLGWICEADRVILMAPYDEPDEGPLRLISGSAGESYVLRPMAEIEGSEAITTLSDPVLQSFSRTGRLSKVGSVGSRSNLDARSKAERAAIGRFMVACQAAQAKL